MFVRLFLLVLLTIKCTKGYHGRAVTTNKFHVRALYDDFEIDSDDNNNNNERSLGLQKGQAIEALQRYNTECKVYIGIDMIFNMVLMIDWILL
jgi:hypothetical protein